MRAIRSQAIRYIDAMEQTPADRIRQQARDATKRALLEAGLAETIDRGGLDVPSIDAICARAGFTRGAFYVHFRDRDHFEAEMFEWVFNDILASLMMDTVGDSTDVRDVIRRFPRKLAERNWPDLHGNIRAGYLAVMRRITTGGPEVRGRHATLMSAIVEILASGIRAGQEAGSLRSDVDATQAAGLMLLTAIAGIVWDDMDVGVDIAAVAETLIDLLET